MDRRFFYKSLGLLYWPILIASPIFALEVGNGLTLFDQSPRLVDTVTTLSRIRARGADYYFILELPKNIGEPLHKLTIQQHREKETITFDLEDTVAFIGKPVNRGETLQIAEVKRNLDNHKISITFDPPISPGKIVTVGFKPQKNPDVSGIYHFGVTAYPTGKNAQGLYLGSARLQFYQRGDYFP